MMLRSYIPTREEAERCKEVCEDVAIIFEKKLKNSSEIMVCLFALNRAMKESYGIDMAQVYAENKKTKDRRVQ